MTETNPAPARYAIFDMDGLLLDTESIYTIATQAVVEQFGKTFDWSIKADMIGRPPLDSARYLIATMDLPLTPEEVLEQRDGILREQFPLCSKLPGAESLVHYLHDNNVPMALATSSHRDLFELKISRHQALFQLFDVIVTGDDPSVKNGKPAPDIFLTAAERINADPALSLVFEDSPLGMKAGIAAGMRVIAVPDPNMDHSRYPQAEQVLTSLEEFDPKAYGLGTAG